MAKKYKQSPNKTTVMKEEVIVPDTAAIPDGIEIHNIVNANANETVVENTDKENMIAEDVVTGQPIKDVAKDDKEVLVSATKVVEKAIQNKPKKSTKRQGVIVEKRLASVVVVDLNGNRFRLTGVNGNVGDTVDF